MDAFIRGVARSAPTSKPESGEASGESTADDSAAVEAGRAQPERGPDGKFVPRRGVPEVAKQQLREEIRAELLAEQEQARERERVAQLDESERADAERYARLKDLPDDHPLLNEGDNYTWLQEYRRVLSLAPKAAKQYRADAELLIRSEREQMARDQDGFRATVRTEIAGVAQEFGVNPDTWKQPGTTWASMTRDAVRASKAPLEARIAELERELHAARTLGPNGLGSGRAPVPAGRSADGAGPSSMDDWIRGKFRNGRRG